MPEIDARLVRCFASVLPLTSDEEIRASNVTSLFDLDSLAGVTLVTLIEEEFGISLELSDILELGSFGAISQFLKNYDCSEVYDK